MENYRGGSLGRYLEKWKEYTSDKNILTIIKSGLCLNFVDSPPTQGPFEYPRGKVEFNIINGEIQKLLSKGVIEYSHKEEGNLHKQIFSTPFGGWKDLLMEIGRKENISPIFLQLPKKMVRIGPS